MLRRSMLTGCTFLVLCSLALSSCVSPQPDSPMLEWRIFIAEIKQLKAPGYTSKYSELLVAQTTLPTDRTRMELGYLLTRPNITTQDLSTSLVLLSKITTDSFYAPLRDSVQREIQLLDELQETKNVTVKLQKQLKELQTQLGKLKAIDGDITKSQEKTDTVPR